MIKCFVCMDKGAVVERITTKMGNETYMNWYSLHCNCKVGQKNRIDHTAKDGTRWYEEPISKYFDTKEIEKRNIEKFNKNTKIRKGRLKKCIQKIKQ